MVICTAIIFWIGASLWSSYTRPLVPPEMTNTWMPVEVMIDGKPVMLGVGIVKWQVPPQLNAAFVQVEKERQAAEAAAQAAQTQPSGTAPAQPPSSPKTH
jgi:hypothetical protein